MLGGLPKGATHENAKTNGDGNAGSEFETSTSSNFPRAQIKEPVAKAAHSFLHDCRKSITLLLFMEYITWQF